MPNNIQQDWLNHKELMLIKGIGKIPGDSNSAEPDPVVVDLLSGLITLEPEDGWSPQIPPLKNGGVWAESPLNDGRQLLASAAGNVIEKITVNIADAGYLNVNKALSGLYKMVNDCRDFWQTETQISPVYLRWYVSCGAGPQFALIYNIDIAAAYLSGPIPSIRATLTIEREPGWRPIPPGANPKLWTLSLSGTPPTTSNVALTTNSGDLVDVTLFNKHEWTLDYLTPLTKNYIDIPATSIPGDMPALVEMTATIATGVATQTARNIYIWRSTRDTTAKDRIGGVFGQTAILNGADCGPDGAVFTKVIDATNGVVGNGSLVTKYIVSGTPGAGVTVTNAIQWPNHPTFPIVEQLLERGTISFFLRCKQNAGAAGDVQARLKISSLPGGGVDYLVGQWTNLPIFVSAYPFGLLYMGTISLPLNSRAVVSDDGRGLLVAQKAAGSSDLAINIDVRNTIGVGRATQFLDLVMINQDEPAMGLNNPAYQNAGTDQYVFDNTGYFTHGRTDDIVRAGTAPVDNAYPELVGQGITLTPHVNNRLYFMYTMADAITNPTEVESWPTASATPIRLRLNIVPRWAGIRDT